MVWGWVLALGWSLSSARAAESTAAGRRIFRKLCTECHGRNGEGVQGKRDTPLEGSWSLDKLTRIIEKTMPENDPDQCVGEDAARVARYIYDTFYSPEARAKKNPARVELVRLTNRQYLNAVADLFRGFVGEDKSSTERGLHAAYFNARGFQGDKKTFERIDPVIHHDFDTESPDPERIGSEEFSIQWRGSVAAEETGDYEILVRTGNGARLWLNDDDEPLIDAWVASGDVAEHKAHIRLLGGRAYPLRLDFFKFKDATASIALEWKPPHRTRELVPGRLLSPAKSKPTLVITTPFPPDDSSVGYERGVAVSKAWDEAVTEAAIEAANHVIRHLDALAGAKAGADDHRDKVRTFCHRLVEVAFRRPLTDDQKRLFVDNQFKTGERLETAVRNVVLLALKSPRFLYPGLSESGADAYDVASRLSFGIWDSLPDRVLLEMAARDRLRSRDEVRQAAERMVEDPRARSKMRAFLHHWLQMDRVDELGKDTALFPDFTGAVIADLRTSLDLFLEDVVWDERSDYRELLLADYLYANGRLAKFYGLEAELADDFVKVRLDPKERAGVVTHPYLLAAFSYQRSTSPIHRGVFLTRNIVGRALKAPPVAVAFKDSEFDPNLTMRQKVAELTRPEACQSCHSVINPLGFSLEHYDAVGRFRTTEGDQPIDAASDYTTSEGDTVRLTGARDLAGFAAGSEQAQNAFVEQLFHQVVKQPARAYGPDVLNRLRTSFLLSDFSIRELLVEIACISALHGVEPGRVAR
jgi:hypothetical protein